MGTQLSKLSRLLSASTPFVARTFRGPRLKRYGALNVILVVLTVLVGVWLAVGTGSIPRDSRVSVGAEVDWRERERQEFKAIFFNRVTHELAVAAPARIWSRREAHAFLHAAVQAPAPDHQWALATGAADLAERHPLSDRTLDPGPFSWSDPRHVERLQAIVDRDLVPSMELYRSPMTPADGVRVVGGVAGFVALVLLLLVAPLFAGTQIAQEVHANTLPPLLGTRLTPRGVVLGLTAGGMAVPGFLAIPQLILFVVAALVTGAPAYALGLVAATLGAAAVLVMLSQLAGLALGKRWAPGLAAIALCGVLGLATLLAIGFAWNLRPGLEGVINVLPAAGPAYLLQEAFFPAHKLGMWEQDAWRPAFALVRAAFSAVAFGVLAVLAAAALTRRITPRSQPLLTRMQGLLAATFASALAVMAMPDFSGVQVTKGYVLSLGAALIPFSVILAGRVPLGGLPSMTTIGLRGLLAEFGGYVVLHAVIALCAFGFGVAFSTPGAILLLWAVGVVALVTIRSVAVPLGLAGAVFAAFSLCTAGVHFVAAMGVFTSAAHGRFADLSELSDAPPLLLLLEMTVVLGIPFVLLRTIRKGTAGLR